MIACCCGKIGNWFNSSSLADETICLIYLWSSGFCNLCTIKVLHWDNIVFDNSEGLCDETINDTPNFLPSRAILSNTFFVIDFLPFLSISGI